ncbi:uncharacterized protein LOC106086496 [Stomoxys calcitrans]|uniref:uncharacterized protein LOC106086496 n=1 Tax=Stomoxys calcitrans TaxID=35570 RepID=UPI0027E232DF|nr:uncharacterized protein LOC106086496 [Stomoxys calcitrans]
MSRTIFLALTAFLLFNKIQTARKPFIIDSFKFGCKTLSPRLKNLMGYSIKVATGYFKEGGTVEIGKPLAENSLVHVIFTLPRPKNTKIMKLLDVKLSVCQTLKSMTVVPMLREIFVEMMAHSNLPCSCPVVGNISMTGLIFSAKYLPTYIPDMQCNLTITLIENQQSHATCEAEAIIIRRKN